MANDHPLNETMDPAAPTPGDETVVNPDEDGTRGEPADDAVATGQEGVGGTDVDDRRGVDPDPEQGDGGDSDRVPPVGQLYQIYLAGSEEHERPFLVPISQAEMRRIMRVFVPPSEFRTWCDGPRRSDTARVVIVYGPEHSGKLTTAIRVGLECAGSAGHLEFLKFQRPGPGSPSLDRYLWSDYAEARSREGGTIVYLAADFLSEGLASLRDLAARQDLEARLDAINAYLILTTEAPLLDLSELLCDKVSAEDVDLDAVFAKHLNLYAEGGEAAPLAPELVQKVRELWPTLSTRFRFPIQIRGLCHLLGELEPLATSEDIQKTALKAAGIGRLRVREWFRSLDNNQRLFSLLMYLFQGIDRQDLDEIYAAAVAQLKATGIELTDPRAGGYEDLLESVHARVETTEVPDTERLRRHLASSGEHPGEPESDEDSEDNTDLDAEFETEPGDDEEGSTRSARNSGEESERAAQMAVTDASDEDTNVEKAADSSWLDRQQVVVFSERGVEEEVQRQVHNYPDLLWSLHELFTKLAERREGSGAAEYHRALGAAIARFGTTRPRRMIALLKDLVQSNNYGIQAVAGAAMGEALANDPRFRQQGLSELAEWTHHAHPSWTFAASFAIWRAYYGVVEAAASRHGASLEDEPVQEVLTSLVDLIDQLVRGVNRRRRQRQALAQRFARRAGGNPRRHNLATRDWIEKWARGDLLGAFIAVKLIARINPNAVAELVGAWLEERLGERMAPVEAKLSLGPAGQLIEVEARVDVISALMLFDEAAGRKPPPEVVEPLQNLLLPLLAVDRLNHDWLLIVMRALRRWHQWPDIRKISFEHLLRIANRCRDESAWRFGLAIVRFWLDTPDASTMTCRLGETLLARIFAMDGSPVELPGGMLGVVLIDSSEPGAHAHLCEIARRLHWLFRSQIDTEVRPLGSLEVLADRESTLPRQSLLAHPRPRLMVPAVEATKTLPAFVLVLAAAEILDMSDALASEWADRLVVAYLTPRPIELPEGATSSCISVDPQRPDALLAILEHILRLRYQAFSQPLSEETAERVSSFLGLEQGSDAEAWTALEHRIRRLDESVHEGGAYDPPRWILGTIRWLAEVDFEQCIIRLREWLGGEEPLAKQIAVGASRMLFKMIVNGEWRPPAATHGSLFTLADPLAEESWSGTQVALAAAAKLINLPEWRELLLGTGEHGILHWLERLAPAYRRQIHGLAGEWQQSSEDGEEVPSALLALAERIQRIAERAGSPMPASEDEDAYVVLVLDADCNSTRLRRRLRQVAAGILNRAPAELGELLVCRLGRAWPLPPIEGRVWPAVLSAATDQRPRLLAPLLERLPRRSVRHVLVLSTGPILDEYDLAASEWMTKVSCYFLDDRWRNSARLHQVPIFPEPELVPSILRYLSQVSPASPEVVPRTDNEVEAQQWN